LNASLNTPVLFLIFNRPDTTKRVFESIREAKPPRLYIAADGARKDRIGEAELCEQTREITNNVDWKCEVKTLFRAENLGCKNAVSSAINWFFENEEEGIILEDDCLPNQSFFVFCQELLNYYRSDERVMHIGGTNFLDGKIIGDASYYFSNIHHIWGWATWRRAWKYYDIEMKGYDNFIDNRKLKKLYPELSYQQLWKDMFGKIKNGELNTWDYQWTLSIWENDGLGIIPNQNLISNIGFSYQATHTNESNNSNLANRITTEIGEIIHPNNIERSYISEKYTLDKYLINGFVNKLKLTIKGLIK